MSQTYVLPAGPQPHDVAPAADGGVWYSGQGNGTLGWLDPETGDVTEHPLGVGSAPHGVINGPDGAAWVTQWFGGSLAMYDPAQASWTEWTLPGESPMPYAVYVDEHDAVWVTDFGANPIRRFDPASEEWMTFDLASQPANVRQLHGRQGEVWGAESAADQLVVVRFGN